MSWAFIRDGLHPFIAPLGQGRNDKVGKKLDACPTNHWNGGKPCSRHHMSRISDSRRRRIGLYVSRHMIPPQAQHKIARRPASVMRTRATSIVRTIRSACAVASPKPIRTASRLLLSNSVHIRHEQSVARIRRVAGCATPTGSAGHAGATANLKLTFHLDHSAGADNGPSAIRELSINFQGDRRWAPRKVNHQATARAGQRMLWGHYRCQRRICNEPCGLSGSKGS
jgi:hypothetical protein